MQAIFRERQLTIGESLLDPSFRTTPHEFELESRAGRREYLGWFGACNQPSQVCYMGSGFDSVLRDALPHSTVVNISKGESDYFARLRGRTNILADFHDSPFSANQFDAVYVHESPIETTLTALSEFHRVVKPGGHLVMDSAGWPVGDIVSFEEEADRHFIRQKVPSEFRDWENKLILYKTWGSVYSVGIVHSLSELEKIFETLINLHGHFDYCLSPQQFMLWKKY